MNRLMPFVIGAALLTLAACAQPEPELTIPPPPAEPVLSPEVAAMYGPVHDNGFDVPAVPARYLTEATVRREVDYWTDLAPGSIVVDPWQRYLYFVLPDERAMRYAVAVGDEGRAFSGTGHIPYSREWPSWLPTQNMISEFPDQYGPVADGMEGGLRNPLGARAMYLHRGNRDTFYRIHGTADNASIGNATSAGCIRLFQQDAIDLESRVRSMARVVVLTREESGKGTVPPGSPLPSLPFELADSDFPTDGRLM